MATQQRTTFLSALAARHVRRTRAMSSASVQLQPQPPLPLKKKLPHDSPSTTCNNNINIMTTAAKTFVTPRAIAFAPAVAAIDLASLTASIKAKEDNHKLKLASADSNSNSNSNSNSQSPTATSTLPDYSLLPSPSPDVLLLRANVANSLIYVFRDASFVTWGSPCKDLGYDFIRSVLEKNFVAAPTCIGAKVPIQDAFRTEELEYDDNCASTAAAAASAASAASAGNADEKNKSTISRMQQPSAVSPLKNTAALLDDRIIIHAAPGSLEAFNARLAFSHALARSAKVSAIESLLDTYLASLRTIPQTMAAGVRVPLSRAAISKKVGELLSIRAAIYLPSSRCDSDSLLDTPDHYWTHSRLGDLFDTTSEWLDIKTRIALLNRKLDYANHLVQVIRSDASERHSSDLEIMIIALISIEVFFELLHFWNR